MEPVAKGKFNNSNLFPLAKVIVMFVAIRHQDLTSDGGCAVSQSQSSSGSPWTGVLPNPMAPDFAAMCTKSAENLAAMQKEWLETLEHARRGWSAWLDAEAKLGSDFATKAAAAKAAPDAAAAYQEWMTRRMELLSKQWHSAVEDGQKLMNAFTKITVNGRGLGGS
jgi:hypothetical protein